MRTLSCVYEIRVRLIEPFLSDAFILQEYITTLTYYNINSQYKNSFE